MTLLTRRLELAKDGGPVRFWSKLKPNGDHHTIHAQHDIPRTNHDAKNIKVLTMAVATVFPFFNVLLVVQFVNFVYKYGNVSG